MLRTTARINTEYDHKLMLTLYRHKPNNLLWYNLKTTKFLSIFKKFK